jgi:hypothetical protein
MAGDNRGLGDGSVMHDIDKLASRDGRRAPAWAEKIPLLARPLHVRHASAIALLSQALGTGG